MPLKFIHHDNYTVKVVNTARVAHDPIYPLATFTLLPVTKSLNLVVAKCSLLEIAKLKCC